MQDSFSIYCHIKPVIKKFQKICVRQKERNVIFYPFTSDCNQIIQKECYSFSYVFDEKTTKKEIFYDAVLPLVEDLLLGKNGVLFTYEVTLNEESILADGVFLPDCFEVIFSSIKEYLATAFLPDNQKDFEKLSSANYPIHINATEQLPGFSNIKKDFYRRIDLSNVKNRNADKLYTIFVSYVEMFKNYIYDLLDDDNNIPKKSKILREDKEGVMYILGLKEKEVKNKEEALEIFQKGKDNRVFVHNDLNVDSNTSYSVFTIKIVQISLQNCKKSQEKDKLIISQLSLVDLSITTNNSSITKSNRPQCRTLLTLQGCIQALQEPQSEKKRKVVPYQNSKLTHLFKSFFEGKGKIKIIVSVSPTRNKYLGTLNPLKFAKMCEDSSCSFFPLSSTPKSNKSISNKQHTSPKHKRKSDGGHSLKSHDFSPVETLNHRYENESDFNNLLDFINSRELRRNFLLEDLMHQQEEFRKKLINVDKENVLLKQEKSVILMDLEARELQVKHLESKLISAEVMVENLEKQVIEHTYNIDDVKTELENKNQMLLSQSKEMERLEKKMQDKLIQEKQRIKKLMEKRLAFKVAELERKLCFTDEKLKKVKEILNDDETWDGAEDMLISLGSPSVISTEFSEISAPITKPKRYCERLISLDAKQQTNKSLSLIQVENSVSIPVNSPKTESKYNSILSFTGNLSNVSKTQEKKSLVELEEKSVSICTERTSTYSRKQKMSTSMINKIKVPGIKGKKNYSSSSEKISKTKELVYTTKKENISVFSVKRENLSNFPVESEIEVKRFSNLPYVYRMTRGQPKSSCSARLRNFFSYSFRLCLKSTALKNICYGKPFCNSDDLWIEHKPVGNLEINTVLQPAFKNKKSVCKLLVEDVVNDNASKYILQHQELDSEGVLETQFYKGDIIHSGCGGAQVVFKNVEKLRQMSPPLNPSKKKCGESLPLSNIENRCTVSLECHGLYPRKN